MKLSAAQIAGIVKYNGASGAGTSFASGIGNPDTDGPIFVAIALAESSGETTSVGGPNSDGSHDYGLWQINDKAHPQVKSSNWKNPNDNYNLAAGIYHDAGYKFTPWSSYKSGAYTAFMGAAAVAWAHPDQSLADKNAVHDAADAAGTVVTSAMSIGDLISALTKSSTWIRIGMGVAGAVMLIIVAVSIVEQHSVIGAAGKILKGGK